MLATRELKSSDERAALLPFDVESQSESKNDEFYYPILSYLIRWLAYGNIIALLPYGYSCAVYMIEGGTASLQFIGIISGNLPAHFGESPLDIITGPAHVVVKVLGITGGSAEFGAGALQVDLPTEIAKKIDGLTYKALHPPTGIINNVRKWLRENFSSPTSFLKMLYRACSYFFFGVGSVAGTYVAIDKVKPVTLFILGDTLGPMLLVYLSGSVFIIGYLVAYGPKCKNGTEFWLTKSNADHGNFFVKTQVGSECLVIISIRTFFSTFSFGHLAKALALNGSTTILLGASGGFFYATSVLVPSTYRNYYALVEDKNPITQDERREAYDETYGQMSMLEYIKKEASRGFLIGWAEGSLVFYILSFELGLPFVVGIIGAGIRYAIFREANLFQEMNQIALSRRGEPKTSMSLSKYGTFPTQPSNTPGRGSVLTADATSITQQMGRTLTNIDTFIDNPLLNDNLPLRFRIVLGIYTGIIAGYNRHLTFRRDIANTLSKLSLFSQSSNQPEESKHAPTPGWRFRDYIPCLRKKR